MYKRQCISFLKFWGSYELSGTKKIGKNRQKLAKIEQNRGKVGEALKGRNHLKLVYAYFNECKATRKVIQVNFYLKVDFSSYLKKNYF